MNKKDFSINNNLFIEDNLIQKSRMTAKSVSSGLNHRREQLNKSINSYRYEHVPDNQYSNGQLVNSGQLRYILNETSARKLQSVSLLEKILSRMTAGLFISCWQSLKALLPHYQYLLRTENSQSPMYSSLSNEDHLKEIIFIAEDNVQNQSNQFAKLNESKKKQILRRQQKGMTLDSLSKLRSNETKSINKLFQSKDSLSRQIPSRKQQTTGNNLTNQSKKNYFLEKKQAISPSTAKKSYRQKFYQYKNRSLIQDSKNLLDNQQNSSISNYNQEKLKYQQLNQKVAPIFSTVDSVNIKSGPIDQNNDRYFTPFAGTIYNQKSPLFSYKSPLASVSNSHRQNYHKEKFNQEDRMGFNRNFFPNFNELAVLEEIGGLGHVEKELLRAQLLEEIIEKLRNPSLDLKLRHPQELQEIQMMKKITRLEKSVHSLQMQQRSHQQYLSSKQQQLLLQKFVQQIAKIRSQIYEIRRYSQHVPPNFREDPSLKIINQQQILLNNYQKQFQKIIHQRQQPPKYQTATFQNQKQAWNLPKTRLTTYQPTSQIPHFNFIQNASNHSLQPIPQINHFNARQNALNPNIQQQKVFFDGKHQAFPQSQRQIRQEQIRKMTERVRVMRGQNKSASVANAMENSSYPRSIRQRYKQSVKELQNKGDHENEYCCSFFNY